MDIRDSEVVELAPTELIGRDVLSELWDRNKGVDEATAMAVAYSELTASRVSN